MVQVSRSLSRDMKLHKLVILCLRFACAWCLKIFQGGSDGENQGQFKEGNNFDTLPGQRVAAFTSNGGDEEFFTIIRRYEDIFTVILTEWSGVDTIQCQLKIDRMDEWFLQLMVNGSWWALERLKDIIV
ncbi:hypothetical protein MRX96_046365 [Rhipicephalus microplus]